MTPHETRAIHFSPPGGSTHGGAAILCRYEDGLHFVASGFNVKWDSGIENVFTADDNQLPEHTPEALLFYTFRQELVTCPECIERFKELPR